MPGAERNGEGNLRDMSIEWVAVGLIAVPQQHAEQKDNNILHVSRTVNPNRNNERLFPAWEFFAPCLGIKNSLTGNELRHLKRTIASFKCTLLNN